MDTSCILPALKRRTETGLKLIQTYSWLLDSYVLDFYVDNHWSKLPYSWQNTLKDVDPHELSSLLNTDSLTVRSKTVWPLSLLTLRFLLLKLSLPRKQLTETKQNQSCLSDGHGLNHCSKNISPLQVSCIAGTENTLSSTVFSKISKALMRHIKPKKQHEINIMAKETAKMAKQCGNNVVVDVGSGLGHLSRLLAYMYGIKVCCMEAQAKLSEQARFLDNDAEKYLSKYLSNQQMEKLQKPVHINTFLNSQIEPSKFAQEVANSFGVSDVDLKFGIVGLHPCGDLAPILLKLFVECPNVVFINIVGCCYMKLSLDNDSFKGYPLSKFVSQRSSILSYEALEIACHAMENYCERLATDDYQYLKIHCFRALLEKNLTKNWPHLRRTVIKSIKHYNNMKFSEYCNLATERLGVTLPPEDVNSDETQVCLLEWKKVVTFYTLRLLLAPLVETIVLLDRLLYLQELGIYCDLIPLFDPKVSPRNHIIVAMK